VNPLQTFNGVNYNDDHVELRFRWGTTNQPARITYDDAVLLLEALTLELRARRDQHRAGIAERLRRDIARLDEQTKELAEERADLVRRVEELTR
jgi:hypothetical protein